MPIKPSILIDTREKTPLPFPPGTLTRRATLPRHCGDYGLAGGFTLEIVDGEYVGRPEFVCERKSLPDLVQSLGQGRDRFEKEIGHLKVYRHKFLIIEAHRDAVEAGAYRSQIAPASVIGSLDAFAVRIGLQYYFCETPKEAGEQVLRLARLFLDGIEKDFRNALAASGQRLTVREAKKVGGGEDEKDNDAEALAAHGGL